MYKTREYLVNSIEKYLGYIALDFKETMIYRFNMVIWILIELIVPLIMIFIWISVFKEKGQIKFFDVNSMVTYYLVANFCLLTTTNNMEWPILKFVKTGQLSLQLVKPIDFFWRCIWGTTADHIVKMILYIPILAIIMMFYSRYIVLSDINMYKFFLFILSIIVSYFLNCGLKMILGTISFWLVDCWGIFSAYRVITQILSGALIPIVLLPDFFETISKFLPFQMLISFPVYFLMGKISLVDYFSILSREVIWMVTTLVFAKWFWTAGLRKYESVGG